MLSWIKNRIKSFGHAVDGIITVVKEEPNAQIHLFAVFVVITLGVVFDIRMIEWMLIIVCISAVFAAEMFNTAIENLSDAVTRETNLNIKKSKDVAAGAVLIVAIGSAVIGVLIFYPYLRSFLT